MSMDHTYSSLVQNLLIAKVSFFSKLKKMSQTFKPTQYNDKLLQVP
jgi:hypothetical protein